MNDLHNYQLTYLSGVLFLLTASVGTCEVELDSPALLSWQPVQVDVRPPPGSHQVLHLLLLQPDHEVVLNAGQDMSVVPVSRADRLQSEMALHSITLQCPTWPECPIVDSYERLGFL